jgi:hypothetical protein
MIKVAIEWNKIREEDILFYGRQSIPRVVEEVEKGRIFLESYPKRTDSPELITLNRRKFFKKYPSHSLYCTNAWLSLEGELFPCPFARHGDVADLIIEMRGESYDDSYKKLEKLGWLKLSIDIQGWYQWLPEDARPTQPQIDTIFDWCKKNHARLPKFLEDKDS